MPKHVKPSKEELEQKQQEAIDEAENLAPEETPEEEPVEPETVESETPSEEAPQEVKEEKVPVEEENKKLKEKFSASARENQKIYAKNRVLNKAILNLDEVPDPTEEELQAEFRDWEVMSEVERSLAKETVIGRRWRTNLKEAQDQAKKIEKWNETVDEYTDDPKTLVDHPELEGKGDDFKNFAKEEANNNVPFNVLVGSFLYEQSKRTGNKGRMFETGTGGPNERIEPKSDKISLEDARKIRETDYDKWKQLLVAGKIESDL